MIIGLSSVVVRRDGLMTAPVDDEIVILNIESDNYVGLDSIGRAVWELIAEPREVIELCLEDGDSAQPLELVGVQRITV